MRWAQMCKSKQWQHTCAKCGVWVCFMDTKTFVLQITENQIHTCKDHLQPICKSLYNVCRYIRHKIINIFPQIPGVRDRIWYSYSYYVSFCLLVWCAHLHTCDYGIEVITMIIIIWEWLQNVFIMKDNVLFHVRSIISNCSKQLKKWKNYLSSLKNFHNSEQDTLRTGCYRDIHIYMTLVSF
jgi:hypothetical protein